MADTATSLSVFIIARNEADRIAMTIGSVVDWVDEVIVVDSGSTDGTVELAQSLGARVLHRDWEGFGPQKVFAEGECRNDWILAIDADEPLSPELAQEIRDLFDKDRHQKADHYWIKIANIFPHEEEPAPWAFKVKRITLYNRQMGGFSSSTVHDNVIPKPDSREGQLDGLIIHHSHRSLEFQIAKYNHYTKLQVADLQKRGRRLARLRLLTEFPLSFLKAYFQRKYMFYGWWGLILAMNYANQRFMRVAKAYEAELFDRKTGGDKDG